MDSYFTPYLDPSVLAQRYAELAPSLHRTPLMRSASLDAWSGAELYFKCENFQKSGAFKMRGVTNALRELASGGLPRGGVCTHSSGNHGQALAWASRELGISCTVVMPSNAPQFKKDAVRTAGGIIIECEPNLAARIEAVAREVGRTGAVEIHPSNQAPVILGQGSAAWELLEDCAARGIELDWVGVPVGGGGLLAGTGFAVAVGTSSAEPRFASLPENPAVPTTPRADSLRGKSSTMRTRKPFATECAPSWAASTFPSFWLLLPPFTP